MNDLDKLYRFATQLRDCAVTEPVNNNEILHLATLHQNFRVIEDALLAIERRFEKMESVLLVSKLSKNELSEVIEKYKLNER